jgi:hypothetical protein
VKRIRGARYDPNLNPSRVASNEALFRQVNERIEEKTEGIASEPDTPELWEFLCECGAESCVERVHLSMGEYESVRADPTHFVLLPGHELPEAEVVQSENERFIVVEKTVEEFELGQIDPRR